MLASSSMTQSSWRTPSAAVMSTSGGRSQIPVEQGVDIDLCAIRQQDGAGLGVERLDLADAVVFFHRSREFVLLDAPGVVGGDRGGRDQAGLLMRAHGEPVAVIAGTGVLQQDPLRQHRVEVFACLSIDGRIERVGVERQVDLWP